MLPDLSDSDVRITNEQIKRQLYRIFDKGIFDELSQNSPQDSSDFIIIIRDFLMTSRRRLSILPKCNFLDWLKLQWYVLKRILKKFVTKEKKPLSYPLSPDEYQLALCNIIEKRIEDDGKQKDKKKFALHKYY